LLQRLAIWLKIHVDSQQNYQLKAKKKKLHKDEDQTSNKSNKKEL
jgi:hypothetical protein